MADYKAVSMNLMHNDIRVTDSIYAPLASNEVQRRIAGLTGSEPGSAIPVSDDGVTNLIRFLSKEQLTTALMTIAQQLSA